MQLRYLPDSHSPHRPAPAPEPLPLAALGGSLSTREREILELLAAGLTGTEIAQRLFVSPETVRTHIRNMKRKLGARTQGHVLVRAIERGDLKILGEQQAA